MIAQHVSALAHLDASHISTHTYFDLGDARHWSSFRLELEISSCGDIHPADCLRALFHNMGPHFVTVDTRSRGIQRNTEGELSFAGDEFQVAQLDPDGYDLQIVPSGSVVFVASNLSRELKHAVKRLLAS